MTTKKSTNTAKKTAKAIKKTRKATPGIFLIKNRTYDILKALATIILPAIDALYITLAGIWGWGFGAQIDATIQAVIAFINVLLGLYIAQSSKAYAKGQAK